MHSVFYCVHVQGVSIASVCRIHSPSQRRKRSFRQARENALSDEKARSQVFISAVEGWLSLLDSIGLSDVQVQNVSVLGKDGEVKRWSCMRVHIMVVVSKCRRRRVFTCCGRVFPSSLM